MEPLDFKIDFDGWRSREMEACQSSNGDGKKEDEERWKKRSEMVLWKKIGGICEGWREGEAAANG